MLIYPSYAGLQPVGLSKQLRGVYTRANSFASGIDTNIFIDFLKGDTIAKEFLENGKDLSTSVLTVMEVAVGLPRKNQILSFEKFLNKAHIKIVQTNEAVSIKAHSLFIQHYHTLNIGIIDALIAATAITYREKLATLNKKHFSSIPECEVVKPY
ncbi:hypothetical protein A2774_00975 [Candidatus Roizmanbacteria bacterium RIFCSPHIGHO2_01_FULL_39_12c]|uniref:PIN domain-containing protein n=1 Tax=Candidatus Roizmanbacteria bacterium RIFCSPHIGHO2_01_FULL_39_12c TaxID=1802031 RepID=A0A1F7G8K6_9BACT|nr:MAG: hypothetical protein A2774_00975 [Candidatus Roizmanbacteria bacterium RIFCSPHIGHO2_01_FULL_39_12c]OGK46404.1 MAG: hypothetical protein A2963_01385 [Candidatus Roizmanbacteria bacterium RIFCSPLOWO2_01_FULL_40_13]